MNITYWSDFNCPYSYIGLKRLSDAVSELGVEFMWDLKSFELEPDLKNTSSMLLKDSGKFTSSEIDEINSIASDDGLDINLGGVQVVSSRNAHRLVKYIQSKNRNLAQMAVFKIYEHNFKLNENIGDVDVLVKIACELGFDESKTRDVLLSSAYEIEVIIDEEDAMFNGLYSTPCYIISVKADQLTVPGAFEKEDFKTALKDLISGEIKFKTFLNQY